MPDAAPPNEVPPTVQRDRLAERKAEITAELADVRQRISAAKGDAYSGKARIANREWAKLLSRETALKAEITRIEVDIVRVNREASEHRWRTETAAQNLVAVIVRRAAELCDDDSDANWHRLEDALDKLRDECPAYAKARDI